MSLWVRQFAIKQAYYSPFDIKYKGLKLLDVPQQNISLHFPEVAQFIDEALAEGGEFPFC